MNKQQADEFLSMKIRALQHAAKEHNKNFFDKTLALSATLRPDMGNINFIVGKGTTAVVDTHNITDLLCQYAYVGLFCKHTVYPQYYTIKYPEGIIIDEASKRASRLMESLFWRGCTNGTFGHSYKQANGILRICQEFLGDILTNDGLCYNIDCAVSMVVRMYGKYQKEVGEASDLTLFMSPSNYNILLSHAQRENRFIPNAQQHVIDEFLGLNLRVVATHGLSGIEQMLLTPASNLSFAIDKPLVDVLSVTHDTETDEVNLTVTYNHGAYIKNLKHLIYITPTRPK